MSNVIQYPDVDIGVDTDRALAKDKLSAVFVKSAPVGKWGDGDGLWFHRNAEGVSQWVYRFTLHGRQRYMGLGGYPAVSLRAARQDRDRWRTLVKQGKDPIKARERERIEAARSDNTFGAIALEAFDARKAELKGDGKAGRWFSPLERHVIPKLGSIPVEDLDQRYIRDVLAPLWHEKAETARKALSRISIVMRHAAAMGLDVDLLATEKAKALLGKSRHVSKNIPAMPWSEIPAFYASLTENTTTHLALRMVILTGVRTGPLRRMHLDQVEGDVWTIPGADMKGPRGRTPDFRVPLSDEARLVIEAARSFARDGYLFPSTRKGVISDMTLSRHMQRRGLAARPHGFRSSLRDWLAEETDAPHEVAEAMLAHVTDGGVVRAYRRTDFLEQRRALAELWASHVTGGVSEFATLEGKA